MQAALDASSGLLKCSRGHLEIKPAYGYDIYLNVASNSRVIPYGDNQGYLGDSWARWKAVCAHNVCLGQGYLNIDGNLCYGVISSTQAYLCLIVGGRQYYFWSD